MASSDARRIRRPQKQQDSESPEIAWSTLSKLLKNSWDERPAFDYSLLDSSSDSSSIQSNVGNLQIWDGARRC